MNQALVGCCPEWMSILATSHLMPFISYDCFFLVVQTFLENDLKGFSFLQRLMIQWVAHSGA